MKRMKEYVYPAIFHENTNGTYTITFPDLPGCISEGKSIGNAMHMAQSALSQWITYLTDKKKKIPGAQNASEIVVSDGEFVNLVCADVKNTNAVRRTVSIPKWMDDAVIENGLSLSRVLQDALRDRFQTA